MLDQAPPSEQYSDLSLRLTTAVVLAAVASVALMLNGVVLALFLGALAAMMTGELTAMTLKDRDRSRLVRISLVACAGYAGTATVLWTPSALIFMGIGLALAAVAGARLISWPLAICFFAICLAVASLAHIRHLPGGLTIAVWVALCVVACDTGAYFAGRTFGGRKLWPSISPNKTRAGAYGGLAAAAVVSAAFWFFGGGKLLGTLLLGVLIAGMSILGDLSISALKRHCGVKDAGTILPGHGGLLDRFDGLIAALLLVGAAAQFLDLSAILGVVAHHAGGLK